MSHFKFHIKRQGELAHFTRSIGVLAKVSMGVALSRALGMSVAPEWPYEFEVGNLFFRAQMNHAFALAKTDIREARAYYDSLLLMADETFPVDALPNKKKDVEGAWFIPRETASSATMLYFHGGGYAFHSAAHAQFALALAAAADVKIFAPGYRLTPEHPHPAQVEDAVASYRFLLAQGADPKDLVVAGDSAGGHLALMTLLALRDAGLPQPALAIGLCPWTDIGARGASLFGNERYDIVQGYMALQFGAWLKGNSGCSDAQLSPIHHNYQGLAPIYLQGGGKEILIDMIRDFARTVRDQGACVMLDVWESMTHDFQGYGSALPESREALERMRGIVGRFVGRSPQEAGFSPCARTEVCSQAGQVALLAQQPSGARPCG